MSAEFEEYYKIQELSRRRINATQLDKKRYLLGRIDWRDRLIALVGSRGVGKTTLLLQHIKEAFADDPDSALYVSLDNIWFEAHSLTDLVDAHYKKGGAYIFIDEIHYQKNWQKLIKNIYDDYPTMHIVYTGSSLLKLDHESGDLSRRQIRYYLPGLSFREYLYFEDICDLPPVTLEKLVLGHRDIADRYISKTRILKHFAQYLKGGYYPFYKEVYAGYDMRLGQIINQILESDYPAVESINYSTVGKVKKMLYILAQTCPQTPNMSKLYTELDTDRNQGLKMLSILERANLLSIVSSEKESLKSMSKPDKIYCDNTNIMYALTKNIDIGTLRETFFLNQLRSAGYKATYPVQGDFLIDDRYLFEVGGRRKSFDQIKDIPDSFLAIDDEEIGYGNKIPLWLFGVMY